MKKLKLVVSDFHVSKGLLLEDGSLNLLEDFLYDAEFSEFLRFFSSEDFKRADVELILNGDFLNTLQVDLREENPTLITESLSLAKVKAIIEGHQEMFEALKEFARAPNHSITVIPGNHDPAFLWPSVRDAFARYLETEVKYPMPFYRFDGFHVEHGNQYTAINGYEPAKYFIHKDLPEPIINLPWGSLFIIEYLNRVKQWRNVVDKVRPLRSYLRWTLFNDPIFGIWAISKLVIFFIKTRFFAKPFWEKGLAKTWQILREGLALVPNLDNAAKEILFKNDVHTVIMGHTHAYTHRVFRSDKEYFNTGTWNDIIFLDIENLGRRRKLTFVLIEYPPKSRPRARLMEWRGLQNPMREVRY